MGPTILIGLDGATFTVLDPYMERGVMPFLAELCARGTRAELRSIMPPLTPPAWTSLVTGKRPGQHGIFDFFQKEEPGSVYFAFASSQQVGAATIWTLASEQQRRVISLNFPLMFPPPPVEGAVVPGGMMPWRQLRLGCHPPGLFDRLQGAPRASTRARCSTWSSRSRRSTAARMRSSPTGSSSTSVASSAGRRSLRHLMETEPADLVGVLFDGVDKLQHLCWRFIDPACRPAQPDARGSVR